MERRWQGVSIAKEALLERDLRSFLMFSFLNYKELRWVLFPSFLPSPELVSHEVAVLLEVGNGLACQSEELGGIVVPFEKQFKNQTLIVSDS